MPAPTKREDSGRKAGKRFAAAALLGFSVCLATAQAESPLASDSPPVDSFRSETCDAPAFRNSDCSALEEPIIDPASGSPFPNNVIPPSRLLAHRAWPEDTYQRNPVGFRGAAGHMARFVAEG